MVFGERTYEVLIVSSSDSFTQSIMPMLHPSLYYPVARCSSLAEARRRAAEHTYDIVVINAPLPDDFGMRFAAEMTEKGNASVMLFCKSDIYEEVSVKAMPYGIICVAKPAPLQLVPQLLRAMCAMRERVRSMEKKQAVVEKKIDEMRLINRAKWLLIECLSMTEADAHRYIEKQAMDLRRSKKEIAENIINTYK